jgi:DNA-binding MarR family transcriptional regulator
MGLIDVETAQHDRRVKQLCLSKQGVKLEGRLTKSQVEHLQRAFEHCGPAATDAWMQVMQEIPRV